MKNWTNCSDRAGVTVQLTEPLIVAPLTMDELMAEGEFCEATIALTADCAEAEPTEFVPVTVTLSVSPTSWGASSAYVWPVAPGIGAQFVPLGLQRLH